MKKIIPLCIIATLMLASCQTKQNALADLRSLNQEIKMNGENYSLNDWTKAGKRYYNINKKITKHAGDYSDAEVKEIADLNGQCVRSFSTGAVTKVQGAMSLLETFLGGFLK